MITSRFRVQKGHLALLEGIFRYLQKYLDSVIQFQTETLWHKKVFTQVRAAWSHTVYGPAFENLQERMPMPKGKEIQQTIMIDAKLEHCKVTGHAAMGAILKVQGTVVRHFSQDPIYSQNSYVCK
jgi:hypothetical protein